MCRAELAEAVAELAEAVAELVEAVAELAEAQSRGLGNSSLGAAHRSESYLLQPGFGSGQAILTV
jgi:hypothetical protein